MSTIYANLCPLSVATPYAFKQVGIPIGVTLIITFAFLVGKYVRFQVLCTFSKQSWMLLTLKYDLLFYRYLEICSLILQISFESLVSDDYHRLITKQTMMMLLFISPLQIIAHFY